MEILYKAVIEPKKCEHHRNYLRSIGYCLKKDIACLIEKYGFENIKTHTVCGPYSDDVIYLCDGLEEKLNGKNKSRNSKKDT